MKCIFNIDGINYLSPSKTEAWNFIKHWDKGRVTVRFPRPFKTRWKITHIERAPSYGQFDRLDLSQIEYKKSQV